MTTPARGTGATSSCSARVPRTPGWPGPFLAGFSEPPATPPLRRVRLQMLQTEPFGRQLTTSVADGDSLRYYPAYDLPGRAALPPQAPAAAAAAAQLLLAQRLDGSLTIGDTHAYDEPFDFDVDEAPYEHLRSRAERLLGSPLPPTRKRWAGVYSQVTGTDIYLRGAGRAGRRTGHRARRPGHDPGARDRRGDLHAMSRALGKEHRDSEDQRGLPGHGGHDRGRRGQRDGRVRRGDGRGRARRGQRRLRAGRWRSCRPPWASRRSRCSGGSSVTKQRPPPPTARSNGTTRGSSAPARSRRCRGPCGR